MKQWAEQLGKAQALVVLSVNASGEGTCETCGVTCEVYYSGTGDECGKCLRESVEYWEHRGGFSSEAIFDSVGACRLPDENSRLYKVVMGAYFQTFTDATDGNPHPSGDDYYECPAIITASQCSPDNYPYIGLVTTCYGCDGGLLATANGWEHTCTAETLEGK